MAPRSPFVITPARQLVFLDALAKGNTVMSAAKKAGGSPRGYYTRRQHDPHFAAAWEQAWDEGGDLLEAEAQRRAVEGVERPVTVAGEREVVKEFSDTLLIFLLKARRPYRFRDNVTVQHTGQLAVDVQHEARLSLADLTGFAAEHGLGQGTRRELPAA